MQGQLDEWIGDLPAEWDAVKTKQLFRILKRQVPHIGQTILSITQRGIRPKNVSENEGQMAGNYDGYQEVFVGDFAMNSMDLLTGWVDQSQYDGLTSPDYRVFAPIEPSRVYGPFYSYVFQSLYTRRVYYKYGQGVSNMGRWRLPAQTFLNFPLPHPAIEEQRIIAKFIESKTSEIDALVEKLVRQVELLERYRRELIARTVTRGLNLDVPMRDSGIEWIGQAPTTWHLLRISALYNLRSQKVSDKEYPPLSITMNGVVPQLETVAKTNDGDNRKLVRSGDFVINSRSDRRGACGISPQDGSCSLINIVLTPKHSINNRYFSYLFRSTLFADEFYRWGHGVHDDLWTTNWNDMKSIRVPVPPLEDQEAVANYLDDKMAPIDSTVSGIRKQIELLDKYRKQVINDAVTGKVRVREVA